MSRCLSRALLFMALLAAGCHPPRPREAGPLSQRGYLWQREWTPAVMSAVAESREKLDGVIILGAEILWTGGRPAVTRANIPWEALKGGGQRYSVALRIAPYPGPFAPDDDAARVIIKTAKSLLADAKAHGAEPAELQIDFDCAQGKLAGYSVWLQSLRRAVYPTRLSITALPAWLGAGDFLSLAREADYYVLQVHSVPTAQETGHASLCDPVLARKWVAQAARIGVPYSVALPTYRCLAGYAPGGSLLGVVMDSVQPAWPADTRILEFATNADEMAGLVHEWQTARPAGMREIIWYRIPVATDMYNWRWPTLCAVMAGRKPAHRLEAEARGENPTDISIVNTGEADERLNCQVTATWNEGTLPASDALEGWLLKVDGSRAVFSPEPGRALRLSPGGKRDIGWLRHDRVTPLRLRITPVQE